MQNYNERGRRGFQRTECANLKMEEKKNEETKNLYKESWARIG